MSAMTRSLELVHDASEDLNSVVARRVRGLLAEMRISASEVGRRIGLTQAAMSRRTLGHTEFTLNEIQRLCDVTGIDLSYLLTGRSSTPNSPDGAPAVIDDPLQTNVRHQGLEPRTR